MTESQQVSLAEFHLQDKAAAWIMQMESAGTKATSIDALQGAMIHEFVPPDEKARAKIKLMSFKILSAMDTHMSRFQDLVEIRNTPFSEAYLFSFSSLPVIYKQHFTKLCPTGELKAILDVYENARTFDMSQHWAKKEDKLPKPDPKPRYAPSSGPGKSPMRSQHSPPMASRD